ncbi:MAG: excinuclease ABC subunit UvrA [Candidatus Lokiarchaeota archaeon]|nr:excinuclease ABC subunit UvrA [Candidatus Lokiarchaeota archaeon]
MAGKRATTPKRTSPAAVTATDEAVSTAEKQRENTSSSGFIFVKGARQHNLKNIDVKIPRDKLVIVTGVSGSGKSSLAMDTIYAEGQRRYLESLSTYARQFLGELNKPDVDFIEGLSPAIAIEQKTVSKNPRSTVGTVTEVNDYLRLLYAHVGKPVCPNCHKPIIPQTSQEIIERIIQLPEKAKVQVLAPMARQKKGTYQDDFKKWKSQGYVRVKVDGDVKSLEDPITLDKNKKHDVAIIVDRIALAPGIKKRLADAVENALRLSDGLVFVELGDGSVQEYSEKFACPTCGMTFAKIEPRMFSFNNPVGACPRCSGLGSMLTFDPELIVSEVDQPVYLSGLQNVPGFGNVNSYSWRMIKELFRHFGQDFEAPVNELDKKFLEVLLLGSGGEKIEFNFEFGGGEDQDFQYTGKVKRPWEGVFKTVNRRYMETNSQMARDYYAQFMSEKLCPDCGGKRLRPESLSVLVDGKNIHELSDFSIREIMEIMEGLERTLSDQEKQIVKDVIKEIKGRLSFLVNVNLDYLSLNRMAGTLSGGESQRIRLASQIGSSLVGVLYVLDEPSIGLHAKDKMQLIKMLKKLVDLGNSVLVIEHDEDFMRNSDHILDLGPGPGVHGGTVVAQGTVEEIASDPASVTGRYLSGNDCIEIPLERRQAGGAYIEVKGARENNLKGIDVRFPLGVFCVVTGVSGAGKSSLVNEILYKSLARAINKAKESPGKHDRILGANQIDKVIDIDQSPIGRTPRSNVVTYTKVFDDIRDIFASTQEAKSRGYTKGRFSFNVKGGRCENCGGSGFLEIEMHFLPNVYVECSVCKGKRYNAETLEVRYKDKTIDQVLRMTCEEAMDFFANHPKIKQKLKTLLDVGMGYMELGQIAPTMSGGEAQRMKLAKELSKPATGKTLYILDEPTTGLHFVDIKRLLSVLQELVNRGNTVVVIEHNLDVIKAADWVVDLGPDGGAKGGHLVAEGTPEDVARDEKSHTGRFLRKVLGI